MKNQQTPHRTRTRKFLKSQDRTAPGPKKPDKSRTNSHRAVRGPGGAWIPDPNDSLFAVFLYEKAWTVLTDRPGIFSAQTVNFPPGPYNFNHMFSTICLIKNAEIMCFRKCRHIFHTSQSHTRTTVLS